jgi:hypothetical protein
MIFVFKTSVQHRKQANYLINELVLSLKISSCNFDLEDCDKILRMESQIEISDLVIKIMGQHNFICEELF